MKNPPWRNGEQRITSPPLFILSLFTDSSLYNLPTVKLCLEINRSQETDGTYCMYTIYCLVKHIFMSHAHSLQSPVDFLCLHQTANSATMKLMLLSIKQKLQKSTRLVPNVVFKKSQTHKHFY